MAKYSPLVIFTYGKMWEHLTKGYCNFTYETSSDAIASHQVPDSLGSWSKSGRKYSGDSWVIFDFKADRTVNKVGNTLKLLANFHHGNSC